MIKCDGGCEKSYTMKEISYIAKAGNNITALCKKCKTREKVKSLKNRMRKLMMR